MKILVIGHAAYDITFPLDEFPIENTKNRVPKRVECGGGPAFNAAYLLGKWGMDVSFAGLIGNDTYGSKLKQQLESVGVNTKYLQIKEGYSTTNSFIMANTSIGSRTILTYRPDNIVMDEFELDFNPDIILMDGQEYEMSLKLIEKFPNAISIIDAGRPNENIINLAKKVNYVVCSKNFAEGVTNIKIADNNSMVELYKGMENVFNGNIIVTLEAKGALYKYNNQVKIMPSLKVKALDSTGAGDIFHGAFTYALANKYDLEKCIMISNVAGGLSVTKIGSLDSMPEKAEVGKYIDDFR
ncbi:MAG: carbohydrate kinase family protein [Firmicutes bacterium]|nr:carbohydrate kinase family protein [Bacillota bacterium]